MSGSKDKQRRRDQREQGLDLRNPREVEAEKKRKKQTRSAITVLVIFAVVGLFLIVINSNFFLRNVTALNVEGERFSITEMNYFFSQAHSQAFQEGWLDPDLALQDQMFNEEQTAFDQIMERAVEMATNQAILHSRAVSLGLTIDEELQEWVEQRLQWYVDNYASPPPGISPFPFPSANSFVLALYGQGMNLRVLQGLFEYEALGNVYINHVVEQLRESYTIEQLEAFYEEHADDHDRVLYRIHFVSYNPELEAEDTPEAEDVDEELADLMEEFGGGGMTRADAREQADEIAEAAREGGEEGFLEAVRDTLPEMLLEFFDEAHTLGATTRGFLSDRTYGDWALDAARQPGDVAVIEDESVFQVLYFLGLDDNSYYPVNVRHILVSPEPIEELNEAGEPLDPEDVENRRSLAMAEALIEAERILAEWESGARTEESFTALAQEYSDDPSVVDNDGLFEDINRQSGFVTPFRDWAMDTAREVGDVGIVETDFGHHIMFFSGYNEDMLFRHIVARDALLMEDYEAHMEEIQEGVTASTTFFARFITR